MTCQMSTSTTTNIIYGYELTKSRGNFRNQPRVNQVVQPLAGWTTRVQLETSLVEPIFREVSQAIDNILLDTFKDTTKADAIVYTSRSAVRDRLIGMVYDDFCKVLVDAHGESGNWMQAKFLIVFQTRDTSVCHGMQRSDDLNKNKQFERGFRNSCIAWTYSPECDHTMRL